MGATVGPAEVSAAAEAARAALDGALTPGETCGSVAQWSDAVAGLQAVVDVATAAQDAAIARLAAIEPEVLETGEVVETHRALGHLALDAPAVVSGALCVTAAAAETRVRNAVRLAADGPEGTDSHTGLRGLHDAMAAGGVDAYRASVVAYELEETPPDVASTVVAALAAWFGREDAPRLRRRARRMLARISPDLVRKRAERARSESRLERWASEPGVDTWHGTFPSEEACRAWAAVDALAQRYVADGVCAHVDRARAKALTDLVEGSATVDVSVVLTTPAGYTSEPEPEPEQEQEQERVRVLGAERLVEPGRVPEPSGPPAVSAGRSARSAARAVAGDDLVEVNVSRSRGPVLVERSWLRTTVEAAGRTGQRVAECDPGTGALADPAGVLGTDAYRPGPRLTELVRARDGRCRFPGCHVAARFCDVDHVRPWPTGATCADNLACLCRRHHRVKQRLGWVATLHPDATMTWVDPTGRERTTLPVDHLAGIVLPGVGSASVAAGTSEPDDVPVPDGVPRSGGLPELGPGVSGGSGSAAGEPAPGRTPVTSEVPVPGRAGARGNVPHSALEFVVEHWVAARRAAARGGEVRHPGVSIRDLSGSGLRFADSWAACRHRESSRRGTPAGDVNGSGTGPSSGRRASAGGVDGSGAGPPSGWRASAGEVVGSGAGPPSGWRASAGEVVGSGAGPPSGWGRWASGVDGSGAGPPPF
ncbi:hypothetical protein JQN72_15115 [Phycicoccus sp. CSK15P-2]|uniref:HNH endonuclease signature motif containing protein n=1 Tax=Phycicoccus sp. CSK15P-2 TaxID=2807627 RepID=UPI00194EDF05|nr:HNH endonuclease signature motif containing protein [Phycicoccus sp. CSK15P-2]MBM6405574.1 hypothetical protein [Phycicoccus sp. CSK15P-2]